MLIKTKSKCTYFDTVSKKYMVKINTIDLKYKKTFETELMAAREHDFIKISKLKYKKTDLRLNFPEKGNSKKQILSKKSNFKRKISQLSDFDISNNYTNKHKNPRCKKYRKKLSNGTYHSLICNQNYCCNICEKKLDNVTETDHILCIERYGNNEIRNHQILCVPCHKWKSGYIDTNQMFISYVDDLRFCMNDLDLFYILIVKKIKYMHSLNDCNCTCKLKTIKEKKEKKENSKFNIKNIFDFAYSIKNKLFGI